FTNTYAKVLMKQHDNSFLADVRLISGGLLFLVLGLVLNGTHLLVTTAGLWPLLAGFSFFVTIKMFYVAVHYLGPNEAVILTNNHPILTPIAGVFLLSEPYSLAKFVGSIIVIISVYFITRKN
ncbi:MAG TPA: EamA family transporter, partial [Candidatus Saccharimonadales bacterium]|nr:EamA family transporter [Candidatus Saccharimonadales bacterium]